MTVPPTGPDPDLGVPGDVPEVPNPDVPDEPGDAADLVPDGDRAAQAESAWPDDDDQGIVPDADRVVPGLDDDV
ncbi:hypothetical protein ASE12_17275 [Aeromicrobium sp. Root236]|uniref:hypothetical protein n=1 Tax=Aeromicrobium sp. Root236 TaxID=1736498 RepID=UPI00070146DA|nr:hypothetical protein [Aeromicrobium sp. Root236]KRC66355.1 hypothetical protein ASE12_17275 [Aeromicrobium sp. Root236]